MRTLIVVLFPLSVTLNILLVFRFVWTRPSRIRELAGKGLVALCSIGWTLVILEVVFIYSMVASDGLGFTLSSKTWFDRHWNPMNSLGYRDVEHDVSRIGEKNSLFVVGDSFVAGHGIEDHRDRFSDVLATQLGRKWEVFNLAKNGWNTANEGTAIEEMPIVPDAIVLSHFVNDIEGAAEKVWGPRKTELIEQPHWLIDPVVQRSHLVNFCYWRMFRFRNSKQMGNAYAEYLSKAYNDEKVWSVHQGELQRIVDYAEENGVRLTVVVFPNLARVSSTQPHTDKVVRFLESCEVPVLDLSPSLLERDTSELVVNRLDAHPSVTLHKEVGTLLLPYVLDEKTAREPRDKAGN